MLCCEGKKLKLYLKRDAAGQVLAVSRTAEAGFDEETTANAPEVVALLGQGACQNGGGHEALAASDMRLVRVLEDVIDLLIQRGLIRFTDLPQNAQSKLLERKSLRAQIHGLDILDDTDEGLI